MTIPQTVLDRARDMLIDPRIVVELLEDIEQSGGPMRDFIQRQMHGITTSVPRSLKYEIHMHAVCYILGRKARDRAALELLAAPMEAS